MRYENGILTISDAAVQLNNVEVKGLEAYAGIIFASAVRRGVELVRVDREPAVMKYNKKGRKRKNAK